VHATEVDDDALDLRDEDALPLSNVLSLLEKGTWVCRKLALRPW
jgi:hypothetical protein